MRRATIIKHVDREELERMYREEKDARIKERLLAIIHIYDGKSISDTAYIVKRSTSSVKRWLYTWNREAYNGLIPRFTCGPNPRMSYDEWDKVVKEIEDKNMSIKDVRVYIKTTRGIDYSYDMVWKVLRKKMKVKYGKPYIINAKRPDDAESILKKDSMKQ